MGLQLDRSGASHELHEPRLASADIAQVKDNHKNCKLNILSFCGQVADLDMTNIKNFRGIKI
jgi:hypothetical protein